MYIAILILKSEAYSKQVVSTLIEYEVFDATVLDGEGLENVATETMPILSEITSLFGQEIVFNKTVIFGSKDRATIERINTALKDQGIDFTQPEVGTLMAFPCELYISEG